MLRTSSSSSRTWIAFALLAFSLCGGTKAAAQGVENYIVVRVNNRIATLVDYQLRRDDRLRAMAAADIEPTRRAELLDGMGEQVLSDIVEELLLLSRADQLGITVAQALVDQELAAARERAGVRTDEEFRIALARAGMDEEDLRSQITTNLTVRQVISREVLARFELTEEDLRRYYFANADEFTRPERRRVREFVLAEDGGSADELTAAAATVLTAIRSGQNASDAVAAEPLAGSLLEIGWVEYDDLEGPLADAVWMIAEGGWSEPISARGGLHVLQVEEIAPPEMVDFDEVRGQIGASEQNRLFNENYGEYVEDLRRDSFVKVVQLPEDAAGFDVDAATSASRVTLTDLEEAQRLENPDIEAADTDSGAPDAADSGSTEDESE